MRAAHVRVYMCGTSKAYGLVEIQMILLALLCTHSCGIDSTSTQLATHGSGRLCCSLTSPLFSRKQARL